MQFLEKELRYDCLALLSLIGRHHGFRKAPDVKRHPDLDLPSHAREVEIGAFRLGWLEFSELLVRLVERGIL